MTAVIAFTAKARNTGTKLKNVDRLVFYKYAEKGDIPFKNVAELREKIVEYSKLVFICACGIAVRTIAPFVKNKKEDFAVVVCDEDGKFAISLLSGHLGGANELAENVAEILGGQAVITTATDVNGITAIDNYAKENNLEIDSMKMAKEVSAQLLNGEKVAFKSDFKIVADFFAEKRLGRYNPKEHPEAICHVEAVLNLLQVFTNDETYVKIEKTVAERVKAGEVITMCTFAEEMTNKGIEIGEAQGIKIGEAREKISVARNLLDLLTDDVIAEKVGLELATVKELREETK